MFVYSIVFLLMTCFTQIRAPDDSKSVITVEQFNSWECTTICNKANKGRVGDLCVKLSGTEDEEKKKHIRENSSCVRKDMKLKLAYPAIPDEPFDYFLKPVGFCDMGPDQLDKCITKSEGPNDLLVWNYVYVGEVGSNQYCDPQYEIEDGLAPDNK